MSLKKIILADAPFGGIVRYRGEWGVCCHGNDRARWRLVDFWWDGRQYLPDIAEVELLVEKRAA